MQFLEQHTKGQGNFGSYLLTIASVLFSMVIGSMVADAIAIKFLGFSLAYIPEGVDLNALLGLLILPFAFMLGTLMACIKYVHKRPILSLFTVRESFDWKRFFTSFFIWGGIMGATLAATLMMGDHQLEFNFNWQGFIPLLLLSLFVLPIQTTAEEAIFRGYLFQGTHHFFKKGILAVMIPGILFGLLHGSNPEVAKIGNILLVYYILTGIFLGVITLMDDGLELPMGYHAVNNIFAALIVTNDWQAFQTEALFVDHSPASFGWDALLTLLVFQPLMILLFARIYRWSNWKKKFIG